MGKIIITENQYKKIKNHLIESEILKSFINEQNEYGNNQNQKVDPKTYGVDVKNGTLTIQDTFEAENAQGSTRDELKLFKGAVFKVGQNFASNGILVAKTKIQMVGSIGGGAASSPRSATVHYYCKSGKFNLPGTPDTYYNEKQSQQEIKAANGFKALCSAAKNPQVSTQGNAGQTTYNSKNPAELIGKKDQTKKLTIPANTAFSYNQQKNGIGFKVNFQNGWFDCKTATFGVNNIQYTSKFLGDALSKNLCKTTAAPQSVGGGGGGTSNKGGGSTKGSGGGGGTVSSVPSNVSAEFSQFV
jgi:hypothetical protein